MIKKILSSVLFFTSILSTPLYANAAPYNDITKLINQKIGKSQIGAANGVASLDGNASLSSNTYLSNANAKLRTLESKFDETIDVRDYGAVCDVGVNSSPTDDTTAIQAAITEATSSNRAYVKVILPGMCRVTSTITGTVSNHLLIEGGGLLVDGASIDGFDLTMSGVGKFAFKDVRFKTGSNGANRPISVIGNGGDTMDNSDFIDDVTVTTTNEGIDGVGFKTGIYLYGLVAYINNLSVTFPQIYLVSGKQTTVVYDDSSSGVGLTLAGSVKGASYTLNGGGSLLSNYQANGGFAALRFTGMSQGGVFNNMVSNWQTHIVYAGSDVVSPQAFTFNNPTSQSGWWSSKDSILFDFEVAGGQYLINNGIYAGPASAGSWTVLKCQGCTAIQFTNNQVNMNYPSSSAIIDSGASGANSTSWVIQNNTFGAPNTTAQLQSTTSVLNFAGMKSNSELTFTNNVIGLLPPIVTPPLVSGAGGNITHNTGNVWTKIVRQAASKNLPSFNMEQSALSSNWTLDALIHAGGSVLANGYITLTLDGNTESATNAISTLRPFATVGSVVEYDAKVYCYEWGNSKYYGIFNVLGTFSITPGNPDVYTLLGSKSTTIDSLYSSSGELFTGRFVLSSTTSSPALQIINSGTATSTLTCTANLKEINLQ